jgi:hypothetical protein
VEPWYVGGRVRTLAVDLMLSVAMTAAACGVWASAAQAQEGVTGPPTIESLSVKSITSKRVTLEATIDPNGLETTYEFWVAYPGCQLNFGYCDVIVVEQPVEGHIPTGSASQTVSASFTPRMIPGYSYQYWVVATNSAGKARSEEEIFTALPAPVVDSESVSSVTSSDGTLEAQIYPEGQAVYYQFQLVSRPSEYPSELECPQPLLPLACVQGSSQGGVLPVGYLPAGSTGQSVSLDMAQAGVTLKPDTTYHYRVIVVPHVLGEDTVEWEGPPVYGADQTFTTPEEKLVPLKGTTTTGGSAGAGFDSQASGTLGSQTPVYSLPGFPAPGGKAAVKGHSKVKHSARHEKRKHHKSKASKHKRHNTARKG